MSASWLVVPVPVSYPLHSSATDLVLLHAVLDASLFSEETYCAVKY
jgi:hypothetical protein